MKFRKRPVVVEAYQTEGALDIPTLEGVMRADAGDWIITGVQGEHYPCKPDIFAQTYEPADAELVVWMVLCQSESGAELLGVFRTEAAAQRAWLEAASDGTGDPGALTQEDQLTDPNITRSVTRAGRTYSLTRGTVQS